MLTGLHDPTSSVSPFELALFALVSYGVFFWSSDERPLSVYERCVLHIAFELFKNINLFFQF